MKTALLMCRHPQRASNQACIYGPAALYLLSEPIAYRDNEQCTYVFVSTSTVLGEPETYAFAADASGRCLSWQELPGSERGDVSHADVLTNLGYRLLPRVSVA